ncbi:MAG: sigma-70 family RNA polymerase sigma factor [Kiritimatiellaeota bacterium]|nr:sigma-70 family RNA polymerase sigma factor [Kiritimatiellota bacterium]
MSDYGKESFSVDLINAQLDLLKYIAALTSVQDARDILQDVNAKLWAMRGEYDPARGSVLRWACQTAKYEILHWRDRQAADRRRFAAQTVEDLSDALAETAAPTNHLLAYMEACYQSLPKGKRDLIDAHHIRRESLAQMGARLRRSPGALAVALYGIRDALRRCVEGKVRMTAQEGN